MILLASIVESPIRLYSRINYNFIICSRIHFFQLNLEQAIKNENIDMLWRSLGKSRNNIKMRHNLFSCVYVRIDRLHLKLELFDDHDDFAPIDQFKFIN